MYIVIKRDKSDALKHKVHELKELATGIIECLEEAYSESHEFESRERTRKDDRYDGRRYRDDYDDYDDYNRDNRGRGGRPRY